MDICSICGQDEDLTIMKALDDEGLPVIVRTCMSSAHPEALVTTQRDLAALTKLPPESAPLVHRLGLYDKLEAVVSDFEQPVEYGVVEHVFAFAHPEDYRTLCSLFGHIAVDGPLQYTASAYLGKMLGNLDRHGKVRYIPSRGTGRWSYDSDISAWAPVGVDGPVTTWAAFAEGNGFDPADWPAAVLLDDTTGT